MKIERSPRPEWSSLPRKGARGVEGRVHLVRDGLAVAELRFAESATIDEHAGENDVEVICLEGAGFVSVGAETASFHAGDRVRWPRGVLHRLWTEGSKMKTLMVEFRGH